MTLTAAGLAVLFNWYPTIALSQSLLWVSASSAILNPPETATGACPQMRTVLLPERRRTLPIAGGSGGRPRDGLYPVQQLRRHLGSWWDFLVTDVTLATT
ncbi:hypothetical protein OHA40_30220 [Nocardia sp. NBC_00508]|uniref:hypothetical protein n=1 Tax=Nocardia sp. NBC_00508 TaxID=2975992 RepID=UPI002E7FEC44|nr:hypothetical protein [Nocardia sp. NBC_00508]WUD65834.1 hypothetical protein OHA40_30220 [Nocardia sp. NBC_00508]